MTQPESPVILSHTSAGVRTLTLNRPDVLNAFNLTMARELERFFTVDALDDAVRAVVVTGAGRAFCAGMDLAVEGNVFGLMPHPEAASESLLGSNDGLLIFRSMVEPLLLGRARTRDSGLLNVRDR